MAVAETPISLPISAIFIRRLINSILISIGSIDAHFVVYFVTFFYDIPINTSCQEKNRIFYKMFGNNLRKLRKSLKQSQDEFAKPLDITGKYISDIERGRAFPSDRILQLIEINYRINRKWLETGQGEKYIDPPTSVRHPPPQYDRHGGYKGHTTDELTGDYKMSEAVSKLIQIYDSEDKKLIRIINRILGEFCQAIENDQDKNEA